MPVGDSYTRFKKFICRPSVPSKKSFNGMDAKSSSFLSDCGHLWPSRYRSFRCCPKPSGKELCLLDRRPNGPSHRRIFNQLGGDQLMYAFPPFSLIQRCLQKVIEDRAQVLLVAPVWMSRPWYPMLLDLLTDQPCLLPVDPLLVHLPWDSLPHPFSITTTSVSRVASIRY